METSRSWSPLTTADPENRRHMAIRMLVEKPLPPLKDLGITITWFSERFEPSLKTGQPLWGNTERLLFSSAELGKRIRMTPAQVTVWLTPGNYVDWLFSGNIKRLEVAHDDAFRVLAVQLFSQVPKETLRDAWRVTHYRYPERKFLQVGESWWLLED